MRTMALAMALFLVACEGPMGPPGAEGPQGPAGPAGTPGPAGESGANLVAYYRCLGEMAVGTSRIPLYHTVYDFSDGSLFTTCEVIGGLTQSTGVAWFKLGQVGADSGGCLVTFDADVSSAGFWHFQIATNNATSTATYHDAGSGTNGRTATLTCTAY